MTHRQQFEFQPKHICRVTLPSYSSGWAPFNHPAGCVPHLFEGGHFCSRISLETKPWGPKSVVAKERRSDVRHFSVGIAQYLIVLTFWKIENNQIFNPNAKAVRSMLDVYTDRGAKALSPTLKRKSEEAEKKPGWTLMYWNVVINNMPHVQHVMWLFWAQSGFVAQQAKHKRASRAVKCQA